MSFWARLSAEFFFEAAHRMPFFPEGHPNARLHGHSYKVKVTVRGEVDPQTGFVIEHGKLEDLLKPIQEELDHCYLNEIRGLELPTGEVIARWIWMKLKSLVPHLVEVSVRREFRGIEVSYSGDIREGHFK